MGGSLDRAPKPHPQGTPLALWKLPHPEPICQGLLDMLCPTQKLSLLAAPPAQPGFQWTAGPTSSSGHQLLLVTESTLDTRWAISREEERLNSSEGGGAGALDPRVSMGLPPAPGRWGKVGTGHEPPQWAGRVLSGGHLHRCASSHAVTK